MSDANETLDLEEVTSSIDFSIVAAVGAEVPLGERAVVAELRYLRGVLSVDDTDHDVSVYNRLFSILFGVRF